ncbi:MAG: hypothetical protein ABF290_03795 [Thiogranum sp.]
MNRTLFVLSTVTGASGTVILILSILLNSEKLLNAGLIALLITALLMIGIVLTGDMGHGGNT